MNKYSDIIDNIDKMISILDSISNTSQTLIYNKGIYIPQKLAKSIYDGHITLILRSEKADIVNQKLLLCDNEFAYGYIHLDEPFLINSWNEFRYYRHNHQVPIEDCLGYELPLYAYSIIKSSLYNQPKGIALPITNTDIIEEAERYINPTGDLKIDERIIGDE